jgi:putative sterol carrier protein
MSDITIEQLMKAMPGAFIPEKAAGVEAVIQFHMTGDQASDWVATIKDGTCEVKQGTVDNPTMALTADSQDYINVVTGKQDAMAAFMQGKLKLAGDLNLAMKMVNFFKLN